MRLCLLVLLTLLHASAAAARDGIRRCEGADGVTIYTDRPCAALDAVERDTGQTPIATPPPRASVAEPDVGPVSSDCARLPDTLLFDLRRAVERGDVNRLAGLYHWPGMGSGSARHVMDRLQRLVSLPAPSVDLVWPEVSPVRENPEAFPPDTPPEDPIGVRIDGHDPRADGPTATQELAVVRHAGCWWISFSQPRRRSLPPAPSVTDPLAAPETPAHDAAAPGQDSAAPRR